MESARNKNRNYEYEAVTCIIYRKSTRSANTSNVHYAVSLTYQYSHGKDIMTNKQFSVGSFS